MTITANVTLDSGLVVTHHKIQSVVVMLHAGIEAAYASVQSWVDKARADAGEEPHYSSHPVAIPLASGIFAKAEAVLVTDTFCPLYGGTVTVDVVLTDLEQAKSKKKAEIESAKNIEMYADKTTSLGVFGSTESDNNKLSIAIQVTQLAAAAGQPAECGYKTADGVYSVYTLTQLEQVALEIAAQVIPTYEKESGLVAQVDAAATVEDVESIAW